MEEYRRKYLLWTVAAIFLLVSGAYATVICPGCGMASPDDYDFCRECGTRLTKTTVPVNIANGLAVFDVTAPVGAPLDGGALGRVLAYGLTSRRDFTVIDSDKLALEVLRTSKDLVLLTPEETAEVARAAGAEVMICSSAAELMGGFTVKVKAYDLNNGKLITTVETPVTIAAGLPAAMAKAGETVARDLPRRGKIVSMTKTEIGILPYDPTTLRVRNIFEVYSKEGAVLGAAARPSAEIYISRIEGGFGYAPFPKSARVNVGDVTYFKPGVKAPPRSAADRFNKGRWSYVASINFGSSTGTYFAFDPQPEVYFKQELGFTVRARGGVRMNYLRALSFLGVAELERITASGENGGANAVTGFGLAAGARYFLWVPKSDIPVPFAEGTLGYAFYGGGAGFNLTYGAGASLFPRSWPIEVSPYVSVKEFLGSEGTREGQDRFNVSRAITFGVNVGR